ncbi:hypothetical protein AVEN_25968-1 [Araneus ventricosus]|uniref:Uncharacterized protein n=1 Tax=Araneus ventricosus TaxID=182803 RepID=A0A4Y2QAZ0_ARAVE|nr:hypothetical protein AVEN_25968-1 [Araneus ventricosus]
MLPHPGGNSGPGWNGICTSGVFSPGRVTQGVKIPTLARPTQKGCKAGRGPVGRPPPACGGRDLLGTIKKMIQAFPEQGQSFQIQESWECKHGSTHLGGERIA